MDSSQRRLQVVGGHFQGLGKTFTTPSTLFSVEELNKLLGKQTSGADADMAPNQQVTTYQVLFLTLPIQIMTTTTCARR